MSLSVVVNTRNSAATLERTLKSVAFADELVVMDMESEDATVEIAQRFTDSVHSHPNVGYVEPARNAALNKATQDWILLIDADEEVPPLLQKLVLQITSEESEYQDLADCFYIPRKNIIFGQWIEKTGWWPDYVLRLFRKGSVEWSDEIHSVPITRGVVKELPVQEKIAIVHHNYQSVTQFIERLNRYTTIQAQERAKVSSENSITRSQLVTNFSNEFWRRFFAEYGTQDRLHGLALSLLQSFSEVAVALKVWELKEFTEPSTSQDTDAQLERAFRQFGRELNYWLADWNAQRSRGIVQLYWRFRRKFQL